MAAVVAATEVEMVAEVAAVMPGLAIMVESVLMILSKIMATVASI